MTEKKYNLNEVLPEKEKENLPRPEEKTENKEK